MKKSIFLFFAAILCAIGMNAATVTSDGTARLYFNLKAVSWWNAGTNGNGNFGYFFNNSTGKNAWSAHAVQHSGDTYYLVIPKGTWAGVILTRNNTSTAPSWDNKWNQTGDITLSSTSNYISKFSESSTSVTWGTPVKPASNASVSAAASTIFVGASTTLTPSLTSNANINDIKSTTYTISPTTGASISGNTFTASAEGTYTITATVTYHPDGYSDTKLQSTATATTTIKAEVPAEETHDVTVSYICGETTLQDPTTVNTVGVETSVKVTAPEIAKYTFANWTLGADVATTDALTSNEINITTKAGGSDFTLVANYEKAKLTYTVTVPAGTENCYLVGAMNGWDVENPIEMTKQGENVFTTTLEGVATTDEYKYISQKGSWDYADVQEANRTWTANDVVTAWKDPLATNVHLVGNMFANWDKTPDKEFRKATKDATTASIVVTLEANKDYELKVRRGDDWTSCTSKITNTVSNLQFSTSNNDNCKMKTTVAGDYTFTWTISSSKLAVTYPTICAITATANDAAMGTISGAGDYGKGSTATLTATPNDGYLFVNWTKGSEVVATTQEYSFKVTEAVALVANFEAAPEEVHNVTVSYVCGGNKIADDQTVAAVGETTAKTVEAPAIFGYTFASWTLGAGVTSADATANPISINIVAGASDYTLTANYTEIPKVTVYFVNNKKWSKVNAYGWKEGEAQGTPAWPGQDITTNKETEQVADFDVYSYSVVPSSYDNIIFNNGSGTQTETFKWTDGKYYYMDAADKYAGGTAEEVEKALVDVYTIMGASELGLSWDLATTGNDMTKQADGTYTLVKEGLDLATTGNYEYKVIKNHSWDWSIPTGTENQTLKVDKDGTYTVTFTLSADKKKLTANAVCTAEKEVILDCSVAGTINLVGGTFDFTDKLAMTYDEGTKTYSKTFIALAAGNYQMKVVYGSDWLGYDKLTKPVPENVTEGDDKKIKFSLAEAGDVTVTYNVEKGIGLVGNFATPIPPVISYVLMGVNNDWTTGIALTRNEANTEFEEYMLLGQAISATDAVKVVKLVDGVKNTFCGDVKEGSAEHTADADGNIVLAEGTYDFYYDVPANKVYIGKQVTPTLVTPSVESGIFSVAEGKYVQFSTGNLQYEVGTNTWSFASEQYEVIGDEAYTGSNNTNYGMNVPGYTGKLDLFGWSSDGKFGVNPSNTDAHYGYAGSDFVDWGELVNETGWYTLTKEEMNYILNRKKDGKKLWALATVCNMNGLILLPDNWDTSITLDYGYVPANFNYTKNQIDATTWQTLETAGAVFLPEGGTRVGGYGNKEQGGGPAEFDSNGDYFHVDNVGEMGYYWLNTQDTRTGYEKCASFLILPGWSEGPTNADADDICLQPQVWSREKRRGNSVRLVKAIEPTYTRDNQTTGAYGTVCYPENIVWCDGATLYEVAGKEGNKVIFDEVTAPEAGMPYIFIANQENLYFFCGTDVAATPGKKNSLQGTFTEIAPAVDNVLVGNYMLVNNIIKKCGINCGLNANRAYFVATELETMGTAPAAAPGRRRISLNVTSENTTTGLDNITNGEDTTIKLIENGQFIIIRNGEKYNAQGVRF